MSVYDDKVPLCLKETQEWFASIIARPIDGDSRMQPISPTGIPMAVEALQYILPSPTLAPHQRIQIYNQQYWWRLLAILHDNFPLTTRLFGYHDFNQLIAIPYLQKYPPKHWSLNHLGDLLPQWACEEYVAADKVVVQEAIASDWAYVKGFFSAEYPFEITEESIMLERKLLLQPHLSLCSFSHRLLPFRDAMVSQQPEYWEKEPFPPLEGRQNYYFVIYRNRNYHLAWSEIDHFQYLLLSKLNSKEGCSISELCSWLEEQDETIQSAASQNLHFWFQEWTIHHWLGNL